METRRAYIAITLMMVIIGLSFMFVKIALDSADTFNILAHRFLFAAIASSLFLVVSGVKLSITRKGWLVLLPLAILYPLLFFTFQTLGIKYTTISEAGIIFAVTPILVAIFASLILKESTTLLQKGAILLSVSGVIYIVLMRGDGGFSFDMRGILFTLLSALSTALYTVFVRRYRQEFSNFTLMYLMMMIGFIVFNGMIVGESVITGDYSNLTHYISALSEWKYLGAVLYLGVLSTAVTQFLSIYAVARLEASKVGVFNNLSSIITVLAGVIFLNETLHYYHVIGGVIILMGIIGSQYQPSKKSARK